MMIRHPNEDKLIEECFTIKHKPFCHFLLLPSGVLKQLLLVVLQNDTLALVLPPPVLLLALPVTIPGVLALCTNLHGARRRRVVTVPGGTVAANVFGREFPRDPVDISHVLGGPA